MVACFQFMVITHCLGLLQVGNEVSRKHARELAEKHYGAAAQLFLKTLSPCELIRVHLERLALMELRYQGGFYNELVTVRPTPNVQDLIAKHTNSSTSEPSI